MFSTDDAGHVEAEVATESQGMLEEFVGYIKSHKVVVLEDLAAHFSLKTEAAVQRVKELEVRGRTGPQPYPHIHTHPRPHTLRARTSTAAQASIACRCELSSKQCWWLAVSARRSSGTSRA